MGNLACTSCHDPATGFTGASSLWNETIVASPGSVPITNASNGVSLITASAAVNHSPPLYGVCADSSLQRDATDAHGGNFWDLRATGQRLGNPAAEQAQGPPLNPLEMGWPDSACLVYKLSQSSYAAFFEKSGAQPFFRDHVAVKCAAGLMDARSGACKKQSGSTPAPRIAPSKGISAFDHFAQAIAQEESSSDQSPFTSKFDAYLAGLTQLTPQEMNCYKLFNGKASCNQCHLSGTANLPGDPKKAPDAAPLFNTPLINNIGIPRNIALPWYCESTPDQYGYTANPAGFNSTDEGLGSILAESTNPAWQALAGQFMGKSQNSNPCGMLT